MYAVIFEVVLAENSKDEYLKLASNLRELLEKQKGFISIERFQSLNDEGKLLSLSFWDDEKSILDWRNNVEHRLAQEIGKERLFEIFRIRVAKVQRDYTKTHREQAPADSK